MKLLVLFPNSTDIATVSTAVPILCGIAKNRKWEIEYFDTYDYKKSRTEDDKDKSGGFKAGFELDKKNKEFNQIIIDLQQKIDEFKPNVIAITALSPEYDFLLKFFGHIKVPLSCKIIIGGIHATLIPNKTIESKLFDLVALGEGEETFNEFLNKVENNEPINDIKGTYFYDRQKTNYDNFWDSVIKNPKRRLLPMNELWNVQHDFSFFNDDYFVRPFDGKKIRRNEIEISRGCPYNCTYCGNSALKDFNKGLGRYVKTRPIESSIHQMKVLVEKFKVDIFSFADECFLAHPKQWLIDFMDAYKREINKPYFYMTRPETITEENIKLLLSYNIPFQASIGVESGSNALLLNVCNRTCTTDHITKAFKILNKYKIRTNTFFIVGFPFETKEDVWKTINLCKKIKPSVSSVSVFQPYPGQKLTQDCIDNGFIPDDNIIPGSFVDDSLLNMPPPYLSAIEIKNLWRTFMLYAILPKKYYKQIEKCEKDYEHNKELYNKLIKLRWDKYDLAEIKGDIKLI